MMNRVMWPSSRALLRLRELRGSTSTGISTIYTLGSRRTFSGTAPTQKTAIVTGASRGIGKAIALRLAQDGHAVCLNDVPSHAAQLDAVVASIAASGGKVTSLTGDVSQRASVDGLVAHAVAELGGKLDIMVANAGIAQVRRLLDVGEADLRRMFEVNVFGVYNCFAAAAEQMLGQGEGGKLIAAASIAAFKPTPLLGHYTASKFAVRGLTQSLAVELAPHGITVNGYAPGIVGTAMWDLIDEGMVAIRGGQRGDWLRRMTADTALGRTSVPTDVSGVVSFLAGPDSDFMTGQTVVVDGGIYYN